MTGAGYCFARDFTVQMTCERLEGVKTRVTVVHAYDWSAGNSPIYYHGELYLAYFDASLLEIAPLWEQVLAKGLQELKAHIEAGTPAGTTASAVRVADAGRESASSQWGGDGGWHRLRP